MLPEAPASGLSRPDTHDRKPSSPRPLTRRAPPGPAPGAPCLRDLRAEPFAAPPPRPALRRRPPPNVLAFDPAPERGPGTPIPPASGQGRAGGSAIAIYRLSAQIVKRSDGRSATAAAAYRAGATIPDERSGLVFDYARRRGVMHAEILAPADTPATLLDRATLWNAIERVERRKDAQLAREIELALPHELDAAERLELVRSFVRGQFVARGMIADVALHRPDRRGDQRNHHAHVMLTLRPLAGEMFGPKERAWNDTEILLHWRESWADAVNKALTAQGQTARVDHRSYAQRGIVTEPEPKMGPVATALERRGGLSHAGNDRRAVQARNNARVQALAELGRINAELAVLDELSVATPVPEESPGPPLAVLPRSEAPQPATIPPRRKQAAGWTHHLSGLWTKVARAVTQPIHNLAKRVARRRRNKRAQNSPH